MGKISKHPDRLRRGSPFYADREKRQELSEKSMRVFGTRGRWHKMVQKGMTVAGVQDMMDKRLLYMYFLNNPWHKRFYITTKGAIIHVWRKICNKARYWKNKLYWNSDDTKRGVK